MSQFTVDGVGPSVLGAALQWTPLFLLAWVAAAAGARVLSAEARHFLWALSLAGLLVLPLLEPVVPAWHAPAAVERAVAARLPTAGAEPGLGIERESPSTEAVESGASGAEPVAVDDAPRPVAPATPAEATAVPAGRLWLAGWLGVALALLAYGAAGHLALRRLERRAAPESDDTRLRLLRECMRALGVRRQVRLLVLDGAVVPMTWGILHPIVLLPREAESWPEERLRAVLLHEAAHVARHDALWNLLARLACALFWFHPGAWLTARALRREAEGACDDQVVAAGVPALSYAHDLLQCAQAFRRTAFAPAALPMAQRSGLERRIRALLDPRRGRGLSRRARAALATGAAGLVVAAAGLARLDGAAPGSVRDWLRRAPVAVEGHDAWVLECGEDGGAVCRDGTRKALSLLERAGHGGAVVMQRVGTGEVVAYAAAAPAEEGRSGAVPLVSPASVAKLTVAALWWEGGLGDRPRPCPARAVLPSGGVVSHFAGRDQGTIRVPHQMIVSSCNTAAAQMAVELQERFGRERFAGTLRAFGFGGDGGAADAGFWAGGGARWTPPPQPSFGEAASLGTDELARAGAGVGGLATTPLHVARFLHAVGNGGVMLAPRPAGAEAGSVEGRRIMSAATAARLQEAMAAVVTEGTATRALPQLEWSRWRLGGKTGTVSGRNGALDGWFAGLAYGPDGRAEYAVVVYLRGGGAGGEAPVGIAAEMTRFYARVSGDEL